MLVISINYFYLYNIYIYRFLIYRNLWKDPCHLLWISPQHIVQQMPTYVQCKALHTYRALWCIKKGSCSFSCPLYYAGNPFIMNVNAPPTRHKTANPLMFTLFSQRYHLISLGIQAGLLMNEESLSPPHYGDINLYTLLHSRYFGRDIQTKGMPL